MVTDRSWLADFDELAPELQAEAIAFIQVLKQRSQALKGVPAASERRLHQGDVFWALAEKSPGAARGVLHPQVVLQDDLFNASRIATVVVCALTSNSKRASEPGNVMLPAGEANLPKPSVAVVSQLASVAIDELGDYIGRLSAERVSQILEGIRFQQRAFFGR